MEYFKVYLAGKIEKFDWRYDLFPRLRDSLSTKLFNAVHLVNGLEYNGPFIDSFEDVFGHEELEQEKGLTQSESPDGTGNDKAKCRKKFYRECIKRIKESNYIFCWLNDPRAFGTIYEIGYATAKGKCVFLAMPKSDFDSGTMWIASIGVDKCVVTDSLQDAWKQFEKWVGRKKLAKRAIKNIDSATESQVKYIGDLAACSDAFYIKSRSALYDLDKVTASEVIQSLRDGGTMVEAFDEYFGNREDFINDNDNDSRVVTVRVFIQEEEEGYVATFPEYHLVTSGGDSYEATLQNAQQTITDHLDSIGIMNNFIELEELDEGW